MSNAKATRREQSLPQRVREFEEEMIDRRANRSNREAMIAHTIEQQRDTFNGYEYRIL